MIGMDYRMTDNEFYELSARIMNNQEVSHSELVDLVFYKTEHHKKYYDLLGCALYQLGVYDNETMRWTDYLQYEHLPILSKIEGKLENSLYRLEAIVNPIKNTRVYLNSNELNVLGYAMTVYKSVLHTLHRDKIEEDLKIILNAMVKKGKELKNDK